jgi:SOS-response transcriptional repressor LexA
MHTIGRLIRARRKELRLTLRELSTRVACAQSYLSQIENERRDRPPSRAMLERLERALRLDPGRLTETAQWQTTPETVRREVVGLRRDREIAKRMAALLARSNLDHAYRSGELRRLVDQFSTPDEGTRAQGSRSDGAELLGALPAQVPVINKVAAGYPVEFTDLSYPARVADEYVSVPDVSDADAFAARVVGDSMEPQYREGDIVVFSPAADTPPGSDCFVRFDRDAETTFKRVYFEVSPAGAERIRLQPLNSAHPPRVVEREEVAGLYAAVYVVRPIAGGGVRRGLEA